MYPIILLLIFTRPFIAFFVYPYLNLVHTALLLASLALFTIYNGLDLKSIKPFKRPLAAFSIAALLSLAFSTDRLHSAQDLYKYIAGPILFLSVLSTSKDDKRRTVSALIACAVIISLFAIHQYFFGFRQVLTDIQKNGAISPHVTDYIRADRVFFPFVTPNLLGGYLAMIIPLAFLYRKKIRILLPIGFALWLTRSIGAFLSLFTALIVYLYLAGNFRKKKIILLAGLLAAIFLLFILRVQTAFKAEETYPLLSTIMRWEYWKDTLAIIKAHPFVGIGPANFSAPHSCYSHNSYLQLWAELGILGPVSFIWFLAVFFGKALKNPNPALIAAISVFLFHNLIDFSFFLPETSFIWWAILGCAL